MKKRYEVQHFTLCDGWINTWSADAFTGTPETFDSYEEAQAALDEFLSDIEDEVNAGQRTADEAYSIHEFRIAEVRIAQAGVP